MGINTIGLKLEGLKGQQSSAALSGINKKSVEHTKHKEEENCDNRSSETCSIQSLQFI